MKLLALSGWKQSGKDSLADYLIAKHGATRVSFADPLKDMAAREYDVPREAFDRPELKEQPILSMSVEPQDDFSRMLAAFLFKEFRTKGGMIHKDLNLVQPFNMHNGVMIKPLETLYWTPRALAILKGSSNRAVRSDFWVAQAIELAKSKGGLIVISDLRYKSEMAQMREAFGSDMVTLRVQRYDTSPSTDPSERDLDDGKFDFHVDNRGTLEELYAKMKAILAQLK